MGKHSLSVLVIDDDALVAEAIKFMLKYIGHETHFTADGQRAVELAKSIRPDVILCDAMMPTLSGMEVLLRLKADPHTMHIPVVFVSGMADADVLAAPMLAGFLPKPFTANELREAVERAAQIGSSRD
jgi:CheY-like chemotaxis protein